MNLLEVLRLNQMGREAGSRHRVKRALFDQLATAKGRHFRGVMGPRGAGKTILLQQLAGMEEGGCYVSLDTLPVDTDLFELVKTLSEGYQFRRFYLDEIYYLPNSLGSLKKIYDFLDVQLTFTSLVALGMRQSAYDLSRRVRLYSLDYFSFKEYLELKHDKILPWITLDDLMGESETAAHLESELYFDEYLSGGILPFALEEPEPLPLLEATIETIINRDIPQSLRLHTDELDVLRKMISFMGRSGVDGINYSSLSSNLGITKYKAEQYVTAFENAYLLQRILPKGTNVLKKPKIVMMPPVRTLFRPMAEARGGLREDYFSLAMRQAGLPLAYVKGTRGQKTPDFLIEHEEQHLVFEVGGKGKGRSQFKGIEADRKLIVGEGVRRGPDIIPLHLFGFLKPGG